MVSAASDLTRLRAGGGGLFGSGGVLFSDAIFGRDSVITAETLLHLYPDVVRDVILSLAHLQGVVEAPVGPNSNEEEPGMIHHEHRELFVGGRWISPSSEHLLRLLASRWGGDETSLTYYGSVDATPLYARLVGHYLQAYGDALLAETVTRRDGRIGTVRESLLAAMDWITRRIEASDLGFVEFLHRNPSGIPFQVWKDSGTSYIHRDGSIANWDAPIAALEVQAYAYDALLAGAEVLDRPDWRSAAHSLRERVIDLLWMPGEEYFAMGTDRDAGGRPRWIESLASNGALALDTGLFDGLPDAERHVRGLARRICGPDFLTEAGVRCRPVSEDALVGFQDYHGTWTVWMKETFDVARGLERQGLSGLARQVGSRLLNAVNVAGANVEFLYVSPDGRVMYDFRGREPRSDHPQEVIGTNHPEAPQLWTAAGALALKWWLGSSRGLHGGAFAVPTDAWRGDLEAEVLKEVPPVDAFGTAAEIAAAYERRGDFILNPTLAAERDQRARELRRGTEPRLASRQQ